MVEDSAGFILKARVMEPGQTDEKTPVALMAELQRRFQGKIQAASFDKGFWSPDNLQELSAIVPLVVLPRRAGAPPPMPRGRAPKPSAKCASGMPGWRQPFMRFKPVTVLGYAGTRAVKPISAIWPGCFRSQPSAAGNHFS